MQRRTACLLFLIVLVICSASVEHKHSSVLQRKAMTTLSRIGRVRRDRRREEMARLKPFRRNKAVHSNGQSKPWRPFASPPSNSNT